MDNIRVSVIIICLVVLAIAIVLESKLKFPLGITCMLGAIIINFVCFSTAPAKSVTSFFPATIVMNIMLATAIFGIFSKNGTSKIIGIKFTSIINGNMKATPFILLFVASILYAVIGGAATYVFLPLVISISIASGMKPMMVVSTCFLGMLIGNFNPFIGVGLANRQGYLAELGVENVSGVSVAMWIICLFIFLVAFIIMYFVTGTYKLPNIDFKSKDDNVAFAPEHKKSLLVLGFIVCGFVLPVILQMVFPGAFSKSVSQLVNNVVVFICAIILILALKLISWNDMLKGVNTKTLFLLVGVTFLIKVMGQAGLNELLSLIAASVPKWLIPPILILLVAFLSFFVSAATLTPMTFPLAAGLAAGDPALSIVYVTCVLIGGGISGISPFSSLGANYLTVVPSEMLDEYTKGDFKLAILLPVICAILAATGIPFLLGDVFASWWY